MLTNHCPNKGRKAVMCKSALKPRKAYFDCPWKCLCLFQYDLLTVALAFTFAEGILSVSSKVLLFISFVC